jgi:hypothetical protein
MTLGPAVLEAVIFGTPTAEAIWQALPFESTASTWGEEVYFSTPVQVERETDARPLSASSATAPCVALPPASMQSCLSRHYYVPVGHDVVEADELAFWVEGDSIVIGYGRTPISQGNEIRLAARTNIWGQVLGDVKQLKAVKPGAPIRVEKAG